MRYYNDSKATNVDATLKALDAFPGRILIILGGKDKGSDYTVLQRPLREKAILALLIGAAAEKIEKQIAGSVAIERAGTLENAVEIASHAAQRGDIVLLAPACASFDQFQNYEHRGRVFKELVAQLENHPGKLRKKVNSRGETLDTDRWLFGVTVMLCPWRSDDFQRFRGHRGKRVWPFLHFVSGRALAGRRPARNVCADAHGLPTTA